MTVQKKKLSIARKQKKKEKIRRKKVLKDYEDVNVCDNIVCLKFPAVNRKKKERKIKKKRKKARKKGILL